MTRPISPPGRFGNTASFDDMAWPLATDECIGDLVSTLCHGQPTRQQLRHAASVLMAYSQMVYDPEKKRRRVVRMLREIGHMEDGSRAGREAREAERKETVG